jgi:hypothetical protein
MTQHPLNKILRNRDKYLKRARDLHAQGKLDEEKKALREAQRWEAMLVEEPKR